MYSHGRQWQDVAAFVKTRNHRQVCLHVLSAMSICVQCCLKVQEIEKKNKVGKASDSTIATTSTSTTASATVATAEQKEQEGTISKPPESSDTPYVVWPLTC